MIVFSKLTTVGKSQISLDDLKTLHSIPEIQR